MSDVKVIVRAGGAVEHWQHCDGCRINADATRNTRMRNWEQTEQRELRGLVGWKNLQYDELTRKGSDFIDLPYEDGLLNYQWLAALKARWG